MHAGKPGSFEPARLLDRKAVEALLQSLEVHNHNRIVDTIGEVKSVEEFPEQFEKHSEVLLDISEIDHDRIDMFCEMYRKLQLATLCFPKSQNEILFI